MRFEEGEVLELYYDHHTHHKTPPVDAFIILEVLDEESIIIRSVDAFESDEGIAWRWTDFQGEIISHGLKQICQE
jgi:hypothetical protein